MRPATNFFASAVMLAALAGGLLPAQQPAPPAPAPAAPATKQATPAEPATQEASPADQPQETVAPAEKEKIVTGSIELGYRWVPRLNGNGRVYRSIVNLGEGPKLFGLGLSFRSPRPEWFDRLEVQASSWGGEPYNTARLDVGRQGAYALGVSYRRVDYFNILPSFNNPLLALGSELSQSGRDIERRMFDVQLDVFPNRPVSPFFTYSRAAGSGPGLTTFVGPGNEYLVNTRLDDALDLFRAGAHLNLRRVSLTLEAGGTRFRDDQHVFYDAGPNPGNRRTPLLGQTMRLDRADQVYRAEGDTFFARLSGQLRAASFLDLSGQFSFSQPSLDFSFAQSSTGNFVRSQTTQGFTGERTGAAGDALRPHPSGNLAAELRLGPRLRVLQSWHTDRFHISSGAFLSQTLTGVTGLAGSISPPTVELSERAFRLVTTDYNRHQVEAIADLHPAIAVRGGYRLEWADAEVPAAILDPDAAGQRGRQRRQVGLGGVQVRARPDLNLYLDAEVSSGDSVFFRTGLLDYQKVKFRGRYRPRPWLSVQGGFSLLRNSNDRADIQSEFRNQETSVSVFFAPREGKRISLSVDYAHSALDSDMLILLTPFFERGRSIFSQDAHSASVFCNVGLPRGARVNVGGSLLVSDGSRPTRFYQPRAEINVPLRPRLDWTSEWRWYGFHEENFRFENFTSHLFSVGLRLKL